MVLTYQELVARAKREIHEITTSELEERLGGDFIVIDCRESDEFEQGAIEGSRLIPRGVLESNLPMQVPNPETEIILVCAVGNRSALAAKDLEEMGYRRVSSLAGGFGQWKAEGRPWSVPKSLSSEQKARYSRHTLLPEVGVEGQVKLLESKVLLIGAGGLGSPAALYLAAAGVGTIGIVDFDTVDASNLQRQILHSVDRIGVAKVESARQTLQALNPDVKIEPYLERLSADNVIEIMSGYDLVVDGGDNFPTRYLINDASLHLRIPVVHGAIFRFEGQASVFQPYEGPCYRCLFPQPPPPELAPSCAEAGVLGVLPGIVGSIEAMEAIKLLLGIGEPLIGKLLTYDALTQEFRQLKLRRNPDCPACADENLPPAIVEYDMACTPAGSVARTH
ncbi:MAG: molybdopterin-synthase adenylyltransferase MoeB [Acidimicrobiia bacterium]|nr:molybdopterin-synthase adenylyltransferase MoeB [Acidimicrobiia bacterium]